MAFADIKIVTITIPTIATGLTKYGTILMANNEGIITNIVASCAGASTSVNMRFGAVSLTTARIPYIYEILDVDGAKTDDSIFAPFILTNNLLYYRIHNPGDAATGTMTVTIYYDTRGTMAGAYTVTATEVG